MDGIGSSGGDAFNVSLIDADILTPGNGFFTFIGTAAFNAAGQLRVAGAGGGNTLIQGNVDGDLVPDWEILVQDGATINPGNYTAGDFVL